MKIAQHQKSKKSGLSAAAKEKNKKEQDLLEQYEKFLSVVFQSLSKEVNAIVNSVTLSIEDVVSSKNKEFFTEEIGKKYNIYSKRIDEIFCYTANSFVLYV